MRVPRHRTALSSAHEIGRYHAWLGLYNRKGIIRWSGPRKPLCVLKKEFCRPAVRQEFASSDAVTGLAMIASSMPVSRPSASSTAVHQPTLRSEGVGIRMAAVDGEYQPAATAL
jgi:hypothetical protein